MIEEGEKSLIISDVHLGYEEELARTGIHVPPQHLRVVRKIEECISKYSPDHIVFLGDIKHRIATVSWREARQVREVVERLKASIASITITPGNHDVGIYSLVGDVARVAPSRGVSMGRAWLLHGHTWPIPESITHRLIIIGHTHPAVQLREEGVAIRRRVFLLCRTERRRLASLMAQRPGYAERLESYSRRGEIDLLVMPHFNDSMSGVDVAKITDSRAASPLLRSGAFRVEDAEALMLDGTLLGRVRDIGGLMDEG